ncbi:hypothetical protein B0H16DRAFT_658985 [Mycena metata]|uniref:Uncharacterized protein n=1 Tax=Mycena metata TaxID=1033252 RepID=A0AAD7JAB7_9AGAR|nr:hypothetical protein B0H16DRAFT_658985 [Mycena metata]
MQPQGRESSTSLNTSIMPLLDIKSASASAIPTLLVGPHSHLHLCRAQSSSSPSPRPPYPRRCPPPPPLLALVLAILIVFALPASESTLPIGASWSRICAGKVRARGVRAARSPRDVKQPPASCRCAGHEGRVRVRRPSHPLLVGPIPISTCAARSLRPPRSRSPHRIRTTGVRGGVPTPTPPRGRAPWRLALRNSDLRRREGKSR